MSKGEDTRRRILERAVLLASRDGLSGLTIGELASDLGVSKSGLFAHFGSKEELQVAVLGAATERFTLHVLKPSLKAPAGVRRLKALFERWMSWVADPASPGGCVFLAAATELDDREGKARDFLVGGQHELMTFLTKAARLAVEQGELRKDLDCEAFAFELHTIVLGYNFSRRLMRDKKAEARARAMFDRLLTAAAPEN
jgi:AcrR family transcriptional regulator